MDPEPMGATRRRNDKHVARADRLEGTRRLRGQETHEPLLGEVSLRIKITDYEKDKHKHYVAIKID